MSKASEEDRTKINVPQRIANTTPPINVALPLFLLLSMPKRLLRFRRMNNALAIFLIIIVLLPWCITKYASLAVVSCDGIHWLVLLSPLRSLRKKNRRGRCALNIGTRSRTPLAIIAVSCKEYTRSDPDQKKVQYKGIVQNNAKYSRKKGTVSNESLRE